MPIRPACSSIDMQRPMLQIAMVTMVTKVTTLTALAGWLVMANVASAAPAPCQAADLHLRTAGDGDLNGMSHGGVELLIQNNGPACVLPALAPVTLYDAHARLLPARGLVVPAPEPASLPRTLVLALGEHAGMTLRWIAGPVYPHNRSVRVAQVRLTLGNGASRTSLTAPLTALIYGPAGEVVHFERSDLRRVEAVAMTSMR